MNLTKSLIVAAVFSVAGLVVWEWVARNMGYIAALDDNKALWAEQRARVGNLTKEDLVVLGSSRAHFDIQLDEWEEVTGRRPLMLAVDGSTPTPIFQDIVESTSFNGTILIGVTPGLFFSNPGMQSFPWRRAQSKVEHFYDRTLAQRLNHYLSIPLEQNLAFLNASEEAWDDDIDLGSILGRIRVGERLGTPAPPFFNFGYVDIERNVTMFDKTVEDEEFAATIQRVWMYFITDGPPPVRDTIFEIYNDLVARFEARGGRVVFVRFPSSMGFREVENKNLPRNEFWERLLKVTGAEGYHFEDYPSLRQYDPPEWSHLSTPDARRFTRDLARIVTKKKEGSTNHQSLRHAF